MEFNENDTIAAISTGLSAGGIGIVRISGPEAIDIADKIFRDGAGRGHRLMEMSANTIKHGYIYKENTLIDEVLVTVMKAPHTYTAENVVEINCHGGILVTRKVLETVIEAGARPAAPGEFTKRAFLNGRIDLSQAEAVMDIISSDSEYALKSSVSQLKGSVKRKIEKLRGQILYEMAYIESAIDDPENYELTGYSDKLLKKIEEIEEEIRSMYETADEGRYIKDGILTVILGSPNVGKSSLLNALSGHERAIVTDIAGTTRDILEDKINIGGFTLRIFDTAGIRDTEDKIEKIGVEKAKEAAKQADLILYVTESEADRIPDEYKGKKLIILRNKTDLEGRKAADPDILNISARTGQGIDNLIKKIKKMFFAGELKFNEEVYITNARHRDLLAKAIKSLELVHESIKKGVSEDFYTIDLMDAYSYLGNIIGADTGEDLVNEIFEKFCMGK